MAQAGRIENVKPKIVAEEKYMYKTFCIIKCEVKFMDSEYRKNEQKTVSDHNSGSFSTLQNENCSSKRKSLKWKIESRLTLKIDWSCCYGRRVLQQFSFLFFTSHSRRQHVFLSHDYNNTASHTHKKYAEEMLLIRCENERIYRSTFTQMPTSSQESLLKNSINLTDRHCRKHMERVYKSSCIQLQEI